MSEPYRGPCWTHGLPEPLAPASPTDAERAKREFAERQKESKRTWIGKPRPKGKRR